ncbi:hypothetical protein LX99_02895 [Mucilaginibacter oryzae]|uniref:Uncharacterized protein n=1 Tax=Mucilaginibacter oryzae TaxID=468058 RepID=A0A316HFS4_9SPHI|nr:hypothetical protein [Mucilaginibacter oryzae]PWK77085.1 hypothetical protein LX99_02895 [Mucilaginibacter oryzae]
MKKTLTLITLLLVTACSSAFSQNIVNPQVDQTDADNSKIAKIETNAQFTIISFVYTANADDSWVQVNKEIFIQTDQSNEHYNYVKSENVAIAPAKHQFSKAGDTLLFKVYFRKIPATTKTIDIIERAGPKKDEISYLNFYNVELTKQKTYITDVKITGLDGGSPFLASGNGDQSVIKDGMMGALNAMGPMYASMAKSLLDAQLAYFKQPGKLIEIAKLHKEYFDALVKQGFTYDQALKIITDSGLIPKASSLSGR